MTSRITDPYDKAAPFQRSCFMITFSGWFILAVAGTITAMPRYPVSFGFEKEAPVSLLVDPKIGRLFTARSALVIVTYPFLALGIWFRVFHLCCHQRGNGYMRGYVAIALLSLLVAVEVVIVIFGEIVASTMPAFDAVLTKFPDLTLNQVQDGWNHFISMLRIGHAISLSLCLFVSFIQLALVCLYTLIPSSFRVPPRYEPTKYYPAERRQPEEVPLPSNTMNGSTPKLQSIAHLFNLHEAEWRQAREVSRLESVVSSHMADDNNGHTVDNAISSTADNIASHTADNVISGTPDQSVGLENPVASLPRFETYREYWATSLAIEWWRLQLFFPYVNVVATILNVALSIAYSVTEFRCDRGCRFGLTGTYPLLISFLVGLEVSRRCKHQVQESHTMLVLAKVVLVAYLLSYIYSLIAYAVFFISVAADGLTVLTLLKALCPIEPVMFIVSVDVLLRARYAYE
ncbi:hypothetical protein F4679DRAFT_337017 [Xylaria curta]|nr:hypothetical protein F4679DRAFT_337017 [Xylaria curta]